MTTAAARVLPVSPAIACLAAELPAWHVVCYSSSMNFHHPKPLPPEPVDDPDPEDPSPVDEPHPPFSE